jgi:hypothetical protein
LIALNILNPTTFAGLNVELNQIRRSSLEVLVKGQGIAEIKLSYLGLSQEGKLVNLRSNNKEVGKTSKTVELQSETPIKAIYIVKYSKEEKTFEFPFIFGKVKGGAKPMKKRK